MNFLNQFIQDLIGASRTFGAFGMSMCGRWKLYITPINIMLGQSSRVLAIMTVEETEGRSFSPSTRGMIQYNNFVQNCELIYAGFRVLPLLGRRQEIEGWSNNIKNLQNSLRWWNKEVFGRYFEEKCILLRRLNMIASRRALHNSTYLKET
ncbi:hypothetical protein CR513_49774, partial [Mucuna pruriens]